MFWGGLVPVPLWRGGGSGARRGGSGARGGEAALMPVREAALVLVGEAALVLVREAHWLCCSVEREGDCSTGISIIIVDADGAADLLGSVLYLADTVGAATVKIDTGIPDPDHDLVIHHYRLDVNAFVPGAVYCSVQEVPKDKSQEIFVRTNFDITIYLIDNYGLLTHRTGKKTRHQFVYKPMKGYSSVQISSH